MSDEPDQVEDHETARLRGPRRLLLIGPLVAFLLAFASSAVGADGTLGFFLLLLLLTMTFGSVGLWVGIGLLVDEFRGEPTSMRRGWLVIAMFMASLVCMTAIGGVANTLGARS